MLSIKRAKDETYFSDAKKHDYYAAGETLPGQWFGQGAQRLGLGGEIDSQHFRHLFYGFSPFDGDKKLVQNTGRWQRVVQRQGQTVTEERRHAWDLTFSAPKSVSLLWALSPPGVQAIMLQCHTEAIHQVLSWAEAEFGRLRQGRNGSQVEVAGWSIALFQHTTSRELDPQLHTHCCLMAVGVTPAGKTGQIESYALYRHKRLLGTAYRAALARQLEQHLDLAVRPHAAGHVKSFELEGVPQSIIDHFSKRAQQVRAALQSQGYEGSHPKVAEQLTLITRRAKTQTIEGEAPFSRWQQAASNLGFSPQAASQVVGSVCHLQQDLKNIQTATLQQAIAQLTQHHSHFSRYDLLRAAVEGAQLQGMGFQGALAAVQAWLADAPQWHQRPEQVVQLGEHRGERQYSTQAMVQLEQALLTQVKHLAAQPTLPVPAAEIRAAISARDPSRPLRPDQQQALWQLIATPGRIKVLTGVPGAGKTEVLGVAHQVWRQAGYRVVGLNFQGRTAADLEHKTGIPSDTIHKTLSEIEKGKFSVDTDLAAVVRAGRATAKQQKFYQYQLERRRCQIDQRTVVILDEGSMVDTRLLKRIADVVEAAGAQWIVAGDANQLPAIGPGGGLAAIAELAPCSVLTEPVRQQLLWQREQTKHLAAGEVETAIRTYHRQGRLQVLAKPDSTRAALISDWQQEGIHNPKDYVILAMTNAEVAACNQAAQGARLIAEAIGGQPIRVNGSSFYVGDRILFRRANPEATVPFRRYGVRNGQFATVEQISAFAAEISVRLDSGARLTLPVNEFPHFRLGYAGTTYFFQGESVVQTFVQVGGALQDLEQTLVQLTRHRQDVRLYTDYQSAGAELKTLLQQMQRSRQKQLAIQIQQPVYCHSSQPVTYGLVQ
ncbi:MAG: relaxase domain-containing protein [Leptolyngbya sp. SIO4C5]|nr:relaxase domain-containing protein [Leptolyngbya sp. SIO4C5]